MARFTVATATAPTATGHVRLTGTANRELLVDYLSVGPAAVSNTIRRVTLQRVTTDGTGTAQTPELLESRVSAFHGTAAVAFTASPTTTGTALLVLDSFSPTNRHGRWSPPRPSAGIYLLDTERVCLLQAGTANANADTVGFADTLTDRAETDRIHRRPRHRAGHFARAAYSEWTGGSSTAPKRGLDKGHLWHIHPYWTPASRSVQTRRTIDDGGGPAPIDGTVRFAVAVTATPAATKIAGGATRSPTVVTARPTGAKIGAGTARATTPVVARPVGAKIAGGAAVAPVATVGRFTGAAVSNLVEGAARFVITTVARATGAKVASGSTRAGVPVVARPAGTKVAGGAVVAPAPVVARPVGAKVAAGTARMAAPVTVRATGAKTAGGAVVAAVPVVARAVASKVASGTALAAVTVVAVPAGAKIVAGVVEGAARFVATIAMRATGTKIASGSTVAPAPVVARATGSRTALGAARAVVAPVMRAAGTKTSQGAARATLGIVATPTGRKLAAGVARFVQSVVGLFSTAGGGPPPVGPRRARPGPPRHQTDPGTDRHHAHAGDPRFAALPGVDRFTAAQGVPRHQAQPQEGTMKTRDADTKEKLPVVITTPADPTGSGAPEFALTLDDPTTWVAGEWAGPWSPTTKKIDALTPLVGSGQVLPVVEGDYDLYARWNLGTERPIDLVDRYRFT